MRRSLLAVAVCGLSAGVAFGPRLGAQAPAPAPNPLPSFEVAAVKPNKSGSGFIRFGVQPGGRFTAENVPLRQLLVFAFQIQPYQLEGVPAWGATDRFDITAKAEGEPAPVQPGQVGPIQYMMRSLLKDRFGLEYHVETKDAPVYNLVLARPDGKLGPKLEKATTDCQALFALGPVDRVGPVAVRAAPVVPAALVVVARPHSRTSLRRSRAASASFRATSPAARSRCRTSCSSCRRTWDAR